jgi:hypothetical protein
MKILERSLFSFFPLIACTLLTWAVSVLVLDDPASSPYVLSIVLGISYAFFSLPLPSSFVALRCEIVSVNGIDGGGRGSEKQLGKDFAEVYPVRNSETPG